MDETNEPIEDREEIADLEYCAIKFDGTVKVFDTAGELASFMWGKLASQWAIFMRYRWEGGEVGLLRNDIAQASDELAATLKTQES